MPLDCGGSPAFQNLSSIVPVALRSAVHLASSKTKQCGRLRHLPRTKSHRRASDTWVRVDETSVFRKLNEHMATMFNEVVPCP